MKKLILLIILFIPVISYSQEVDYSDTLVDGIDAI